MDAQLKARWVEALRSGEYQQGNGTLRCGDDQFCCLGVLAKLAGLRFEDSHRANATISDDGEYKGYKQIAVIVRGREDGDLTDLWHRNDGLGDHRKHSFAELADYIEANL